MKLSKKLDILLSEDAKQFASIFNYPRISPWIIKQYNNGYTSKADYELIVNWVTNNNPSLDDFTFDAALKRAKEYAKNIKENEFDPYMELQSSSISLDFENGRKWLDIGPEDCNAICHRLQFDYSDELRNVFAGKTKCWALQDPQDNTLCVIIDTKPFPKLLGQLGQAPNKYHEEIKNLCIRKGLNTGPEAYNNAELSKALNNGELNINDIKDLRALFKRMKPTDIINNNLIKYTHYAPLSMILEIYNKTNHSCLLKYVINYMLSNNMTHLPVYKKALSMANRDKEVFDYFKEINTNDNRVFATELDKNVLEIQSL